MNFKWLDDGRVAGDDYFKHVQERFVQRTMPYNYLPFLTLRLWLRKNFLSIHTSADRHEGVAIKSILAIPLPEDRRYAGCRWCAKLACFYSAALATGLTNNIGEGLYYLLGVLMFGAMGWTLYRIGGGTLRMKFTIR